MKVKTIKKNSSKQSLEKHYNVYFAKRILNKGTVSIFTPPADQSGMRLLMSLGRLLLIYPSRGRLMSRNDGQHLLTRPRGHSIASPSYSIPR
jgi:hypothetical protein